MQEQNPLMTLAIFLAVISMATASAWALMIRMPGQSHAGAPAPQDAGTQAMAERLEREVRVLAGGIGERSVWNPAGLERAARHIEQALQSAGYATAPHAYESHGVSVRNIEASLRGTELPEEIVLVGAHYDSVRGTVGANDNGSGVAALLEIARQLAGAPLARTVRFVAFVNEEPPHFNLGDMGSRHYADMAIGRGDRIVAMFSLETIGCYFDEPGSQRYPFPFNLIYPDTGDFIGFVGNIASRALVRRSLGIFRDTTPFPSEGVAAPAWIPGVAWSDHASFWRHGVPAVMVTDTAPFRYPYYHTTDDRPEHLDYARMAVVTEGLTRVVRTLAAEGI
jgi:hypothetical protein